jgi:hypothetical protein
MDMQAVEVLVTQVRAELGAVRLMELLVQVVAAQQGLTVI